MSETIGSPGVYTRENEQRPLPQVIGQANAAIVGPTAKGPAFVPTVVHSIAELEQVFGPVTADNYTVLAAYNYLRNAPSVTVTRVLGNGSGYELTSPMNIVAQYLPSGSATAVTESIAFLHPSQVVTTDGSGSALFETTAIEDQTSGSVQFVLSGSFQTVSTLNGATVTSQNGNSFTASLESVSDDQFSNVFSASPNTLDSVYLSSNFKKAQKGIKEVIDEPGHEIEILFETGSAIDYTFDGTQLNANTPWVTSQKISNVVQNLFKVHTISSGRASNFEIKIAIENVRAAGTIAGSSFGSFDVVVRSVDQTFIPDTPFSSDTETVLEVYTGCNLDPDSANYIGRVIGDTVRTVTSAGKLSTSGDYINQSSLIRVEVAESVKTKGISATLVPFGFRAPVTPIPSGFTQPPAASYIGTQVKPSGIPSKTVQLGFNYNFTTLVSGSDNLNYLSRLPDESLQSTGSNSDFYLGDYNASSDLYTYSGSIDLTNSDLDARKFTLPLQGGSDGHKPNVHKAIEEYITATNVFGYDVSTTSADGYSEWKKAIDVLSNKDEVSLNLLALPGILHRIHSPITNYALEMVETRADAVFILDNCEYDKNIATNTSTINTLDSSYAATYYPWMKQLTPGLARPMKIPPSAVIPGVFSLSATQDEPFSAPAGLTRGNLAALGVVDVQTRVNVSERDTLYTARINPIYVLSSNGPVVWGQKTLLSKTSALNKLNVRLLLIELRTNIGNASRSLVFDPNTASTRQRFTNIVNPYLDSVQQKGGIYAYEVIMDETNNTPDVIDRNLIIGQIRILPTKTGEVILLDFNIEPTGTTFG